MPIAYYGPKTLYTAIMTGNTDLFLIGDSQSTHSQYRAMHGFCRNIPATVTICGRVSSGDKQSAYDGVRVLDPGAGTATNGTLNLTTATGDSEAAVSWCPQDSSQISFSGDHGNTTRVIGYAHAFPDGTGAGNMYLAGDPFLNQRMKGWVCHRASNATERLVNGRYRRGWYVGGTLVGSIDSNVWTMGTGGGLERSPTLIMAATGYTSSTTESLEFRAISWAGAVETGGVIQFGCAVMHRVEADDSRSAGLVFGSCAESSWAASTWNTNFTQAVWQNWFTGVTTGPTQTVIAIMLGHNAETGDFTTNLTTLMSRLRGACFTATGAYPKFLLIAPWESDQANSMDAAKNTAMKALVGVGTAYGDVACVSLYEAFGAAEPGMVGLHPASNAETDLVWGEMWDQIDAAAAAAAPSITSIHPTSKPVGAIGTVTATGTAFVDGAVLSVDAGMTLGATTFNSSTEIQADYNLTAAGTSTITVTNPDAQTDTTTFEVTASVSRAAATAPPTAMRRRYA